MQYLEEVFNFVKIKDVIFQSINLNIMWAQLSIFSNFV
jgi:hypothetical protein